MKDLPLNLSVYKPSGTAPLAGVVFTLLFGLVAAIPLGYAYAVINYYNPIVQLNILILVLLGVTLGWIIAFGVRFFSVRNVMATVLIALSVFSAAYLVQWATYVAVILKRSDGIEGARDFVYIFRIALILIQEPKVLLELIKEINAEGIWTLGSRSGSDREFKGLLLAAVWLGEALVILWETVNLSLKAVKSPYSERLGKWLEPRKLPVPVAFVNDRKVFFDALSRGDYSALTTPLWYVEEEASPHAKVTLYEDAFEPCVSVNNVHVKNKKKKSEKAVVQYLKVMPSVADSMLKALGGM